MRLSNDAGAVSKLVRISGTVHCNAPDPYRNVGNYLNDSDRVDCYSNDSISSNPLGHARIRKQVQPPLSKVNSKAIDLSLEVFQYLRELTERPKYTIFTRLGYGLFDIMGKNMYSHLIVSLYYAK